MAFSGLAYVLSVAAVIGSAGLAWRKGDLRRRTGVDIGFANHGGMWGDLMLLPIANALIVPWLSTGWWIALAATLGSALSIAVHVHWYGGGAAASSRRSRGHMWPSHARGSWWRDLAPAGWAHVVYVAGELALLCGFLLFPMPRPVVWIVAAIFTLHVPLGLLQPRWYLTRRLPSLREQPLLVPLLTLLWIVTALKLADS